MYSLRVMVSAQVSDNYGLNNTDFETTALGRDKSLQETIAQIINIFLSVLGIIAVIIILLGGFKWMTAQGNEEKTDEAKKLIGAGVIGLVIILAAYAIAKFVITNLKTATGAGGGA